MMDYLKAFIIGGLLCMIGQILIDKTRLTPARILVSYVVIGVLLGAIGIYEHIVEFAGAGATVPLTGFGYNIAKGVKRFVRVGGDKRPSVRGVSLARMLVIDRNNRSGIVDYPAYGCFHF
jgi:stage V sporulation protein AE